tara:strand:+ start:49 stop:1347 length:1299 start_codon:yes stop_codon:yes gene_type:complete
MNAATKYVTPRLLKRQNITKWSNKIMNVHPRVLHGIDMKGNTIGVKGKGQTKWYRSGRWEATPPKPPPKPPKNRPLRSTTIKKGDRNIPPVYQTTEETQKTKDTQETQEIKETKEDDIQKIKPKQSTANNKHPKYKNRRLPRPPSEPPHPGNTIYVNDPRHPNYKPPTPKGKRNLSGLSEDEVNKLIAQGKSQKKSSGSSWNPNQTVRRQSNPPRHPPPPRRPPPKKKIISHSANARLKQACLLLNMNDCPPEEIVMAHETRSAMRNIKGKQSHFVCEFGNGQLGLNIDVEDGCILHVQEGTQASRWPCLSEGDFIVSVQGKTITDPSTIVSNIKASKRPLLIGFRKSNEYLWATHVIGSAPRPLLATLIDRFINLLRKNKLFGAHLFPCKMNSGCMEELNRRFRIQETPKELIMVGVNNGGKYSKRRCEQM